MRKIFIIFCYFVCLPIFGSRESDEQTTSWWSCCFSSRPSKKDKMPLTDNFSKKQADNSSFVSKSQLPISFGVIDSNLEQLKTNIDSSNFAQCSDLILTIKDQLDLFFQRGSISQSILSEVHIIKHVLSGMQDGLAGDLGDDQVISSLKISLSDLCKRISKIGSTALISTPPKKESLLDTARRAHALCFCEAQKNNVALIFDAQSDSGGFSLTSVEHSSETVGILYNLLINAIKYRSKTDPKLILTLAIESASLGKLFGVFSIKDNGVGMSDKTLNSLFTLGFRAEATKHISGSGIGLNSCKIAVERMGGTITVKSEVGKGTEFTVRVPCEGTSLIAQRRKIAKTKFRVGAADDDIVTRKMIGSNAVNYGIFCECFTRCEALYEAHKKLPYDLLLLDENVNGGRNGSDIAVDILSLHTPSTVESTSSAISSETLHYKIPAPIMVSISGTKLDEEFLKKAGIKDCLTKPLNKSIFDSLVPKYFDLT